MQPTEPIINLAVNISIIKKKQANLQQTADVLW